MNLAYSDTAAVRRCPPSVRPVFVIEHSSEIRRGRSSTVINLLMGPPTGWQTLLQVAGAIDRRLPVYAMSFFCNAIFFISEVAPL